MNGLALRINKSAGRKSKTAIDFLPISVSDDLQDSFGKIDEKYKKFFKLESVDEQLVFLKNLVDNKQKWESDILRFLVILFLHAPPKHPVKCFVTRYVTKNCYIQTEFSVALAEEIKYSLIKKEDYKSFIDTVSRLATCIENFPSGSEAVKIVDCLLGDYLKWCLQACVTPLKEFHPLSPTEKNEVFNLAHLALRLLLYVIQKTATKSKFTPIHIDIKAFIDYLMFDEDVPMDTKSVCGILFLTMHLVENGDDSWTQIIQSADDLNGLLKSDAAKLSLYSAVATTVPSEKLQNTVINGSSAVVLLIDHILAIGERNSSESVFTLGVSRTVLCISKALDALGDRVVGLAVVGRVVGFAWAHLDHQADSVRHLTVHAVAALIHYCTTLRNRGEPEALNKLFTSLTSLDMTRRSYYVSLTSLASELGARDVMRHLPNVIGDVIDALALQPVQASATTALETLLQKHVMEASTDIIYECWIEPVLSYVAGNTLEPGVLNILEGLLTKAVKLDHNVVDYIIPYIKQSNDTTSVNLKCMLMVLSVARMSGVASKLFAQQSGLEWKGVIGYHVLERAAIDAADDTRVLSLSLIVESPKSTEVFSRSELYFVLYYLKYNINAQSPNFRQLTLSLLKKFTKRLGESYKVFKREYEANEVEDKVDYYVAFVEELRRQCFEGLIPGANYSRRFVSLQLLLWCEQLYLDGYQRLWCEEYVEVLLLHLEDSYENNKKFALDILENCPDELIRRKTYSISLDLKDILTQASSVKPTECVSAAYKLRLLLKKLPDNILQGNLPGRVEGVTQSLLQRLVSELRLQLQEAQRSVTIAAARAPLYGLIHCMGHVLETLQPRVQTLSGVEEWRELVASVLALCEASSAAVAAVVNSSSPEGHLPCDGGAVEGAGDCYHERESLPEGRRVTAQMVLLCAWRTVKEVSLVVGRVCWGMPAPGVLREAQLQHAGAYFTALLAETKHRGAFEQAYLGFTYLLNRLWVCSEASLHALPRAWLRRQMAAVAAPAGSRLCATRRSAGLPFIIQALVTTELQVTGNSKCFHQCMSTLLRLARPPQYHKKSDTNSTESGEEKVESSTNSVESDNLISDANSDVSTETRTHSVNILRALFRNSALEETAAPYVEEGLIVSLLGFEGVTWAERNSSTLVFSALVVRVFGVQRARGRLVLRNKMTGRIFFLRYPRLYDFMLDKLKEATSDVDGDDVIRPSLFPILLLLARLYPSSLEGTVSNLKLSAFIPLVVRCARSAASPARALAAAAAPPLVPDTGYVSHMESLLKVITDENIKRNYCHGILLQLLRLLEAKPDNLAIDEASARRVRRAVARAGWVAAQGAALAPCYLITDEYLKVLNMLIWRFPDFVDEEFINEIKILLDKILFDTPKPTVTFGRELCLANALYLLFVIKIKNKENIIDLALKGLSHDIYEVVLSILNCILIKHKSTELDCAFQEHISMLNLDALEELKYDLNYKEILCKVLKESNYLECTQKSLKLLALDGNYEDIVKIKTGLPSINEEIVIDKLIYFAKNEHENINHIYMECLSNFVLKLETKIDTELFLEATRLMFARSSSDNSDECRQIVVSFLEKGFKLFLEMELDFTETQKFEWRNTLWATAIMLLEDENESFRQRTSNVICEVCGVQPGVSTRARELVRGEGAAGGALGAAGLVVAALMDFRCQVEATDEITDECRVFDQNERYNTFLEESEWSRACAHSLIRVSLAHTAPIQLTSHTQHTTPIQHIAPIQHNAPIQHISPIQHTTPIQHTSPIQLVTHIINHDVYRHTLDKLCNNNIVVFRKLIENHEVQDYNPKIKIFYDTLCNYKEFV